MRFLPLILVAAVGCKRPPEAPQGLDDSTNYLMKNFYADDPTFQAGIQGFVDWYAKEGDALVGEDATVDTVDAYTVGDLTEESVGYLPIDDEILVDPKNETYEPRDLSRAKGVVSLAEMKCNWKVAEELLVRKDQHVVFSGDFEGYQRTFLGSRADFEGARKTLEFAPVDAPLEPFTGSFDPEPFATTLLMTENVIDPSAILTANMDPYPMNLDLRHGVYDIDGEPRAVLAIITYNIGAAWGSGGDNALLQGFSIELNIERGKQETLRMLAVWSEPKGGGVDPDSAIALSFAVKKAGAASDRMSDICAGEIDIPPE